MIDVNRFDAIAKALGYSGMTLVFALLGADDPWTERDPPGRWIVGLGRIENSRYTGGHIEGPELEGTKGRHTTKGEPYFHGIGDTPEAALADLLERFRAQATGSTERARAKLEEATAKERTVTDALAGGLGVAAEGTP